MFILTTWQRSAMIMWYAYHDMRIISNEIHTIQEGKQ